MRSTAPLYLVTTCGTSALTNGADAPFLRFLRQRTNARGLTGIDEGTLAAAVARARGVLTGANPETARAQSAEINGILAVLAERGHRACLHLLVHTDTDAGEAAARLVGRWLQDEGLGSVEYAWVAGLRTDDPTSFRLALGALVADLAASIEHQRKSGAAVVFNLTGGFKSVNGFLQSVGAVLADQCVYLFESGTSLMVIPRLPVTLDLHGIVARNLPMFRRLAVGYPVRPEDVAALPESIVDVVAGRVILSPWGAIAWSASRDGLLGRAMERPLSPRLTIERPLIEDYLKLPTQSRARVHQALDALAAVLDGVPTRSPAPVPSPSHPGLHEVPLGTDQVPNRILGIVVGDSFVAKRLV